MLSRRLIDELMEPRHDAVTGWLIVSSGFEAGELSGCAGLLRIGNLAE